MCIYMDMVKPILGALPNLVIPYPTYLCNILRPCHNETNRTKFYSSFHNRYVL